MPLQSIFNLVRAAGDMLTHAQSQIVAVGNMKCIKLTTLALNGPNYLPCCFEHAHGACPTFILASYALKMSLKSIFNLVSAAGDMLAGAQSQIMATEHM